MFTMKNYWIIFSYTIPAVDARARMRMWRRVTAIGAVPLKTGLQVLPCREDLLEHITWLIGEVNSLGGEAVAIQCERVEGIANPQIEQLFQTQVDPEFSRIQDEARALLTTAAPLADAPDVRAISSALRKLRKRCESVRERDFFPSGAAARTSSVLDTISERLRRPDMAAVKLPLLNPGDFQGRIWVTRARPYIDRLGSAWLIRRFIDREARFRFLLPGETPDQDQDELPFDMAVGDFTHQGELITFEVLLRDFALNDPVLARMSELIRDIDIREEALPDDAALLKTMLDGLVAAQPDDHQLLERASLFFDALHGGFTKSFQGRK
jgi:hypothetical protein